MIRVVIPFHLRTLANVSGEIALELDPATPATIKTTLDALETKFPMLRGTIRDHGTLARRPFVRYFACGKDWSLESVDSSLPEEVVSGREPFMVVGAIAGG